MNQPTGTTPPPGSQSQAAASQIASARALAAAGQLQQAETAWRGILERDPAHVEAMTFLASASARRKDYPGAIALLRRAHGLVPDDPQILKNLGVSCDAVGDLASARSALETALRLAPDHFPARLHLASILERSGHPHEALVAYFRAITAAQSVGQWLNEATTPPWLHDKVRHAMRVAYQGRSALFNGCLEPLRERFGASELARVQQWLDLFVDSRLPASPDPRQRPKFMYFPGLPTQPYYGNESFPFIPRLEEATAQIREEMLACVETQSGVEPFLGQHDASKENTYLAGSQGKPAWDAFFFYRHGQVFPDNAARCPQTSALLEELPLVRIRDHAPEICFSLLTAGTHILPHHGVTNTRLVLHLPLVVPPDCAIVVGGEQHAWREGKCVVFDDTYLHEAWNRSDRLRVVLIMDVWNPGLTEAERLAITELVQTIGDFNRATEA